MAVYTRSGDDGSTGLPDGSRVAKDVPRLAAVGAVDELNSHIGLAGAAGGELPMGQDLRQVQRELLALGAALAGAELSPAGRIGAEQVRRLEEWIDRAERELPVLAKFVLPGGSDLAARLHVARTVCRRAERTVVTLSRSEEVPAEVLVSLNRLGDLLFTYARLANRVGGVADVS